MSRNRVLYNSRLVCVELRYQDMTHVPRHNITVISGLGTHGNIDNAVCDPSVSYPGVTPRIKDGLKAKPTGRFYRLEPVTI